MNNVAVEVLAFGDQAVLIRLGNTIDPSISQYITVLNNRIKQKFSACILFTTPAYCSLVIGFNVKLISLQQFMAEVNSMASRIDLDETTENMTAVLTIPVCYEDPFAPDMKTVESQTSFSRQAIINAHSSTTYRVYMMGFLPGFAYMGKLPEGLAVTRKKKPDLKVPAGSVAIAGLQTSIYPQVSPGGWQIIGRTPVPMYQRHSEEFLFLFLPGDRVRFEKIDEKKYRQLEATYAHQRLSREDFMNIDRL